jgi:hypothetical protein
MPRRSPAAGRSPAASGPSQNQPIMIATAAAPGRSVARRATATTHQLTTPQLVLLVSVPFVLGLSLASLQPASPPQHQASLSAAAGPGSAWARRLAGAASSSGLGAATSPNLPHPRSLGGNGLAPSDWAAPAETAAAAAAGVTELATTVGAVGLASNSSSAAVEVLPPLPTRPGGAPNQSTTPPPPATRSEMSSDGATPAAPVQSTRPGLPRQGKGGVGLEVRRVPPFLSHRARGSCFGCAVHA